MVSSLGSNVPKYAALSWGTVLPSLSVTYHHVSHARIARSSPWLAAVEDGALPDGTARLDLECRLASMSVNERALSSQIVYGGR